MANQIRFSRVLILHLLVLLSIVIASCNPTPPPVPETLPPATDTPTPVTPEITPGPRAGFVCDPVDPGALSQPVETNAFFVEGQVVLFGLVNDIDRLVGELASLPSGSIELKPLEDCQLDYWRDLQDVKEQDVSQDAGQEQQQPGPPERFSVELESVVEPFYNPDTGQFFDRGDEPVAMRLYGFDPVQVEMRGLLRTVERLQGNQEFQVYVEPNYLTGHLAKSVCSSPFSVEGSPFSVEGSPFAVEGSPNGGLGAPADPGDFLRQRAFEIIGAGEFLHPEIADGQNLNGAGVRVGIFDTSPYKLPAETPVTKEVLSQVNPPLELTVHHPFTMPVITASPTVTVPGGIAEHGPFVAGLVYGLAPASEIHLVRVLNENGCGDLFSMVKGINQFISDTRLVDGFTGPVVLNLSLGVLDPGGLRPERTPAELDAVAAGLDAKIAKGYHAKNIAQAIELLAAVMYKAYLNGMVVVAAAGNDSIRGEEDMLLSMELPAVYNRVIGVAATDLEPRPGGACYSNRGDVAAPGGEAQIGLSPTPTPGPGPGRPAPDPVPVCQPMAIACPTSGDPGTCPFGVISLVSDSTTGTGYGYWVGTSFATPLVSGLAALAYQKTNSRDQVYTLIETRTSPMSDTVYGSGVISVTNTLLP